MTTPRRPAVLLVDDEPHSLAAMRMALEDEFECLTAPDAAAALRLMEEEWVQTVICDQRMPGQSGVEFLTDLRERWPEVVRIIVTGYTDPAAMTQAINAAGIHQFVTKPWHPEQLLMAARNGARLFDLVRENGRLTLEMRFLAATADSRLEKRRRALRANLGFETIARAPGSPMEGLIDTARRLAAHDVPVLLTGEPGTGKARLAHAMHLASLRAERPFHALQLAGMPEELIAVELFGARRGVLTGGVAKVGLVQKADRGTLYLGGIEALPPALQLALARLLAERSFTPVGGQESLGANLRLIAGAGVPLAPRAAEGSFRPELYHALAVADLPVPPLRARRGDVALLARQIADAQARALGIAFAGFEPADLARLEAHDWPGNLPELTNAVTRMLILAPGAALAPATGARTPANAATLRDRVGEIEAEVLRETLARHRWNKSRAAAALGLSRVGLRAKLDRYGIADPADADPAHETATEEN